MQAHDLVELAALAASHGPAWVRLGAPVSAAGVERYWAACKCRLDRWSRSLRSIRDQLDRTGAPPSTVVWRRFGPVFEEILTGEILARVWAAVCTAQDQQSGREIGESITRSVLIGHLEARNRAISLVLQPPGWQRKHAVAVNRMRRQSERWTDVLISHLLCTTDVSRFAVDADRAKEFADDLRHEQKAAGTQPWSLLMASLRSAYRQAQLGPSPNPDLNADIATSILASFPPDAFDSVGVLQSLWMVRMTSTANDAAGMLAELLAPEERPSVLLRRRDVFPFGDSDDPGSTS